MGAETGGAEEAAAAAPPAAEFQLKQLLPQLPLRNWTRGEGGGSWHLPGGVQHWQEVDHPAWRIPCLTILPMSSFLAQPEPKFALPSVTIVFSTDVTNVNNVFSVAADSSVSWTGQIFEGKRSKERKRRRRRPTTANQDPRRPFIALSLLWNSCGNTSIKTISIKKK